MTDSVQTIFQKLIDRLSSIPKKHLDLVIAQLETTKYEINELLSAEKVSKPKKTIVKKEKKAPTKKKEDENAIKKPLSSYMLFCKERRSGISNVAPRDVLKKLGELWKALSDDEKSVYTEKAAEAKLRYEEDTKVDKKPTKTVKNAKDDSDSSEPIEDKKKSVSPYIRFCNDKRASVKESNPGMDAKTIIKTLGAMWRALSEEEQQSYKNV